MNPWDIIETVQTDFAARLQSLEYFGDIMVAAPRLWKKGEHLYTPKEVNEAVDRALTGLVRVGGKIGAAVRVFQPSLAMKKTNGREALLKLVCRCEVNPILNASTTGTNKNVSRIGYEVLRAGQGFTLMQGFCTLFADGDCFQPYVSNDRKFATVDVIFQSNFAVSPLDAVVMPTLTQADNGLVTLTNKTSGATIFYTLNSKLYPAPQVPGAKQYDAPFLAASGTNVRWAAYLPGLAGSQTGFQTINY